MFRPGINNYVQLVTSCKGKFDAYPYNYAISFFWNKQRKACDLWQIVASPNGDGYFIRHLMQVNCRGNNYPSGFESVIGNVRGGNLAIRPTYNTSVNRRTHFEIKFVNFTLFQRLLCVVVTPDNPRTDTSFGRRHVRWRNSLSGAYIFSKTF